MEQQQQQQLLQRVINPDDQPPPRARYQDPDSAHAAAAAAAAALEAAACAADAEELADPEDPFAPRPGGGFATWLTKLYATCNRALALSGYNVDVYTITWL